MMELCTTVLVCDTADKISKGAWRGKIFVQVVLLSESAFLLDVPVLFWCLRMGEEVCTGKVLGFLVWWVLELSLWASINVKDDPVYCGPPCFCFSFIGLISCHSGVFSQLYQENNWLPQRGVLLASICKSLRRTLAWSPLGLIGGQWLSDPGHQWESGQDTVIRRSC